jgi:hypothetical protein
VLLKVRRRREESAGPLWKETHDEGTSLERSMEEIVDAATTTDDVAEHCDHTRGVAEAAGRRREERVVAERGRKRRRFRPFVAALPLACVRTET